MDRDLRNDVERAREFTRVDGEFRGAAGAARADTAYLSQHLGAHERETFRDTEAIRRDIWTAEREAHRDREHAVRDLWGSERNADHNFRAAERTAYENTGRLADRLAASEGALVGALKDLRGDLRADVAALKGEVCAGELRTAEHIHRDGEHTRELLHRFEERRHEDLLRAASLENSDLKMRLALSHLRGEDDDDWRGRGRRRRVEDDNDTSVRQTVVVEDRQGMRRDDERFDRHDRRDVDIRDEHRR